jgi:hypothetical protein
MPTYEYYLKHWSELEANVAADPELAFLESKRVELELEEIGLRNALDSQAAGKVQSQEGTRAIEGHVARGNALMVQIHDLVRGYYGRDAEKLGLFRLKVRRKKAKPPESPTPLPEDVKANKKPSEPGPNPTQTATPETDGTT